MTRAIRTTTYALPSAVGGKQLAKFGRRLSGPIGILLSLALLVVVVRQARTADWSILADSGRLSAVFWIFLCAYYLLSPCAEWLIYSRLWGFDRHALPALLRKLVSNGLLLDYLGDVQFLAWAQSHKRRAISAFAAVKDVSVLSVLTGNVVTLIMTALAWPLVADMVPSTLIHPMFASLFAVMAVSSGLLLLGKRIFSHAARTLWWIGAVLALRTIGTLALGAAMWHLLMPETSVPGLIIITTLRTIVSRLPLVPNKELLFAGLAVFAFGKTNDVAVVTAMIASLVLAIHLTIAVLLAVLHLCSARIHSCL